jgi:hypothetical protein
MTPQEASLLARLTKAEATVENQGHEIQRLMLIINSLQKSLLDARSEVIALEGRRRTNKI